MFDSLVSVSRLDNELFRRKMSKLAVVITTPKVIAIIIAINIRYLADNLRRELNDKATHQFHPYNAKSRLGEVVNLHTALSLCLIFHAISSRISNKLSAGSPSIRDFFVVFLRNVVGLSDMILDHLRFGTSEYLI